MIEIEDEKFSGLLEGFDYVQDGSQTLLTEHMKEQLGDSFRQDNQEKKVGLKLRLESLSDEAIEVVLLVLNTPTELSDLILSKKTPMLTKNDLKLFLRQRGWRFKNIFSAFKEIKKIFSISQKCVILNQDSGNSFVSSNLNQGGKEMAKMTLAKMKGFAKEIEVTIGDKKLPELTKAVMDDIQEKSKDKKWRNAKKNQEIINWFNAELDRLEKDSKADKDKKEKKDKTSSLPDFSKMDGAALLAFTTSKEAKDFDFGKPKKLKKMKEKKLRKLVVKVTSEPADIEDAKAKAAKAKADAKKKKKDKPAGAKKAGVVAFIMETIKEAGKPISKEKILKAMVKKFPDREEKAMKSTIGAQLSGQRLADHGEKHGIIAADKKGCFMVGEVKVAKKKKKKEKKEKKK